MAAKYFIDIEKFSKFKKSNSVKSEILGVMVSIISLAESVDIKEIIKWDADKLSKKIKCPNKMAQDFLDSNIFAEMKKYTNLPF